MPKDRQVLGCGQPDVIGGFNNDFTYKGFTFFVLSPLP